MVFMVLFSYLFSYLFIYLFIHLCIHLFITYFPILTLLTLLALFTHFGGMGEAYLLYSRSEVLTERDIPSLGVRTGGWDEVDVSTVAVAVVALGGGGSPNMF